MTSIVAKPVGSPPKHKLTEQYISSFPLGKQTVALLKKGIDNRYIGHKSVDDFFKQWQKEIKKGTCYGQSSAVIAAEDADHTLTEETLVKNAQTIDVICLQLLSNLAADTGASIRTTRLKGQKKELLSKKVVLSKNLHKVEKQAKKGSKNAKKILKQVRKTNTEVKAAIQTVNSALKAAHLANSHHVPADKIEDARTFLDQISALTTTAITQKGVFEFVRGGSTGDQENELLLQAALTQRIKELQKTNEVFALRVSITGKKSGHAIALFPNRLAVYDANQGMIKAESKKAFLELVESIFYTYSKTMGKITSVSMDIFRKK